MSNIEAVELSIEKAKEIIALKNKLEKLFTNREFRAVIEEGYFRDEALRLVGLLADAGAAKHREDVVKGLDAISQLRQFFLMIKRFGEMAEMELASNQDVLDDMRAESMMGGTE